MIIMAQDKEACYNTDNAFGVWLFKHDNGKASVRIFSTSEDDNIGHFLGLYASGDRAKDVLDLIYNLWNTGAGYLVMPEE